MAENQNWSTNLNRPHIPNLKSMWSNT